MKKGTKIFLSIILVTVFIFSALLWWWCGFFYSTSSYFYKSVSNLEHIALPTIESLPEHKSVKYKYFKDYIGIWTSEAYTMIVKYDDETYKNQKEFIYEPFKNIEDLYLPNDEDEINRNTSPIEFDGFSFEMYSVDFPKAIYFVGTNDETNQIAYIYFVDHDLDEISEPYSVFIDESCGW